MRSRNTEPQPRVVEGGVSDESAEYKEQLISLNEQKFGQQKKNDPHVQLCDWLSNVDEPISSKDNKKTSYMLLAFPKPKVNILTIAVYPCFSLINARLRYNSSS